MRKLYFKMISWPNLLTLLFWLGVSTIAFGQSKKVNGSVQDQKGEGIPGVSITIKGVANRGTTTDGAGKFSLSGVDNKTVLKISSIGFESQEVSVGTQTNLNITL